MQRASAVRPAAAGAIAGVVTAVVFALVHDWIISDIWFSVVPMGVAGALCGASLAWTYTVLFSEPALGSWFSYVALQLLLLLTLGVISVALFDPVVPMAVLIAANEPPADLIAEALPLTVAFMVLAAGTVSLAWGRHLVGFASSLVTSAVVITLLGLNVSVLGLVEMSRDSGTVLGTFFALIALIMAVYAVCFLMLRWPTMVASPPYDEGGPTQPSRQDVDGRPTRGPTTA